MGKWGVKEQEAKVDRYSTETKRAAIKDIESGIGKFAVAMKYKVAIPELNEWLHQRERINDDKCVKADQKNALKRLLKKQNRQEKPMKAPRIDRSEVPQPRILPLQEILDGIRKKEEEKHNMDNELLKKRERIREKTKLARQKVIRRERGAEIAIDEESEELDESSIEEEFIPRVKFKYYHVMFDDRYYTYKTIFTHDKDVIEIWDKDNIIIRPNEFYQVHKFIQNNTQTIQDDDISSKKDSNLRDSFSNWDEKRKEGAYEKLRNVDLYLSDDSDDVSVRHSRNERKKRRREKKITVNSSDDMIEMPVYVPKEIEKHLSSSSVEDELINTPTIQVENDQSKILPDTFERSSITEEETNFEVNEILEDKNLWSALSTDIIHELHTSRPSINSEYQEPMQTQEESKMEEPQIKTTKTRGGRVKKDTGKKDTDKKETKPKPTRGRKKIEKLNENLSEPVSDKLPENIETKTTVKAKTRKGRTPKDVTLQSVDSTDKISEIEIPTVPIKKTRAKKVIEPITEDEDNVKKITTRKGKTAKKVKDLTSDVPVRKGRSKKNVEGAEEPKTEECKKSEKETKKGRGKQLIKTRITKKGNDENIRKSNIYEDLFTNDETNTDEVNNKRVSKTSEISGAACKYPISHKRSPRKTEIQEFDDDW